MSPDHEDYSGLAGQAPTTDYDGFAETYAAETESNLINGYYARPAILNLAGDVAGRRILDVGCGAGPLFEALRDRGAIVTGVDPTVLFMQAGHNPYSPDYEACLLETMGFQLYVIPTHWDDSEQPLTESAVHWRSAAAWGRRWRS